mmetsp:Transcript_14342/g.26978  ORF Transcript_14342/g.26978 Transcript_14342/m.26978 type:complete len:91 (+) Transcript_14342:294-566(+)
MLRFVLLEQTSYIYYDADFSAFLAFLNKTATNSDVAYFAFDVANFARALQLTQYKETPNPIKGSNLLVNQNLFALKKELHARPISKHIYN